MITIFTYASWTSNSSPSGLGFVITINSNSLLLARAASDTFDTLFIAEMVTINLALSVCTDWAWCPDWICCDCPGITQLLKCYCPSIVWHMNTEYEKLKRYLKLECFSHTSIKTISREENDIVDALANFGRSNPRLSLFLHGKDRLAWLEDLFALRNLSF